MAECGPAHCPDALSGPPALVSTNTRPVHPLPLAHLTVHDHDDTRQPTVAAHIAAAVLATYLHCPQHSNQ